MMDAETGTLKTRDWKTRDLKSMESVTIFKSKSYEAEIIQISAVLKLGYFDSLLLTVDTAVAI